MEPHGRDNPIEARADHDDAATAEAHVDTDVAPAPLPMPPIQGVLPPDAFETTGNQPPPQLPPDPDHLPHLIPAADLDPWGLETSDPTPTDPWALGVIPPDEDPPDVVLPNHASEFTVPGIEAEVQTPAVTREEQAQLLPAHPAEDLAVHNAPAAERRQKVARHVSAGYSPSQPQSPRSGATELFDFAEPSVARETSQCESAIEPADDEFVATTSDFGDQTSHDPDYRPAFPSRKGGGVLTIPLICIGIATIACTTLLPLADDNHRQSWEREKLKQDLAHLREQVRVNDEFLHRVADDPTLAERLAQRQMKYIRQGSSVLPLRGAGNHEMSPFHLVAVPPPKPLPSYQPAGGALAVLARNPRTQLYASGAALLLIAAGLVLGYVPRPGD